ncbi:MAG: glycine cleavage system aminomethyltransferase GcvT [Planctomycetota bacterium]|jgi:aminomethyltransferase
MKETALRRQHESLGARMVSFAGWLMPVQYNGILDEVRMVRSQAGLFDLGHMGRVRVTGGDATAFLQRVQTQDASAIPNGAIRYAMILDSEGQTQDDVLVYRQEDDGGFFMVVNAVNTDRDLRILREAALQFSDLVLDDQTAELGTFAIQGPLSQEIVQKITAIDLSSLKYYRWTEGSVAGHEVEISRTGYTGEDGFEVYAPQDAISSLWAALLDAGHSAGLAPAGLASRDTLRLEAGMPLYGHEIDETTTPLEAGLSWAVRFNHDFTGREALERIQAAGGPGRKLVGLTTASRRVPRQGYPVLHGEEEVGKILSGAASPTLETNIATCYLPEELSAPGTTLMFAVKNKREAATVTALPFYKRQR